MKNLLLIIVFWPGIALTQSSFFSNHYQYEIDIFGGVGDCSTRNSDFGGYLFGGAFRTGPHVFSFQHDQNGEFVSIKRPNISNTTLSITYGLKRSSIKDGISFSAGPGIIEFTSRGQYINKGLINTYYEPIKDKVACIIISVRGDFDFRGNGFGVRLYGNLNSIESFVGFYIFLQLGWEFDDVKSDS